MNDNNKTRILTTGWHHTKLYNSLQLSRLMLMLLRASGQLSEVIKSLCCLW